jgi:hypothetical protein
MAVCKQIQNLTKFVCLCFCESVIKWLLTSVQPSDAVETYFDTKTKPSQELKKKQKKNRPQGASRSASLLYCVPTSKCFRIMRTVESLQQLKYCNKICCMKNTCILIHTFFNIKITVFIVRGKLLVSFSNPDSIHFNKFSLPGMSETFASLLQESDSSSASVKLCAHIIKIFHLEILTFIFKITRTHTGCKLA